MPASLASGIVSRVMDGYTLVLDLGEKIQLSGVNSPELARENHPAKLLANEAKSAHEGVLADGWTQVEVEQEVKDRYGRGWQRTGLDPRTEQKH